MIRRKLSVRLKTHCAQEKKIDPVKHFQIVFDYLVRLNRQAKKYLFDQIRNMDETPQFIYAPSNSTITSIGTQTVTLTDTLTTQKVDLQYVFIFQLLVLCMMLL